MAAKEPVNECPYRFLSACRSGTVVCDHRIGHLRAVCRVRRRRTAGVRARLALRLSLLERADRGAVAAFPLHLGELEPLLAGQRGLHPGRVRLADACRRTRRIHRGDRPRARASDRSFARRLRGVSCRARISAAREIADARGPGRAAAARRHAGRVAAGRDQCAARTRRRPYREPGNRRGTGAVRRLGERTRIVAQKSGGLPHDGNRQRGHAAQAVPRSPARLFPRGGTRREMPDLADRRAAQSPHVPQQRRQARRMDRLCGKANHRRRVAWNERLECRRFQPARARVRQLLIPFPYVCRRHPRVGQRLAARLLPFLLEASPYGLTRMQLSISLRLDFQWRHLPSKANFLP
ncbi:protein of unknown function [Paraburkholderia dioscoreae]|uniref:Uncharacterized protein n=1 Tax=Paraburkholderia dioscoreae TaxID=2604047 RepID=A0A5Q4ZMV2_9BURK|nr:protein of unknown function [Paraburkholderia dioscoreae]